MKAQGRLKRTNLRTAGRLLIVTCAMFGFGYALVPLYDLVCDITGINGKTGVVSAAALTNEVDETRWVTVQFLATTNQHLPWEFRPLEPTMRVHPGALNEARFYARNRARRAVVAQAVPSVAPTEAAMYFNKTECFCFTRQRLGPGEAAEMPVKFVIDTRLPRHVRTVSLSYTFFESEAPT